MVAEEFDKIVKAGATEYMLVNMSEVRDYVMGARMLADIYLGRARHLCRAQRGRALHVLVVARVFRREGAGGGHRVQQVLRAAEYARQTLDRA